MQTINIIKVFKEFMDNASEKSVNTFKLYCLGGFYTYDEYMTILEDIYKSSGIDYLYKSYVYIKRYKPNDIPNFAYNAMSAYLDENCFYVSEEKRKFVKDSIYFFNYFIINPAFPFIILPKMYDFIKSVEKNPRFYMDMIDLVEEWKSVLFPIVLEFCSFKKYYTLAKDFCIFYNKNEIVTSSTFVSKIERHDELNNTKTTYNLNKGNFHIHCIKNYD